MGNVEIGRPRTNLVFTEMYSVGSNGQVIRHNFAINPKDKYGAVKLNKYLSKGFTLEEPSAEVAPIPESFVCEVCGKECQSQIGLVSHQRTHKVAVSS